ncbi:MAG TPA: hypothetical protein DEF47_02995 [Herpetosiphon sp.]|uniref:Uncharacterized protein n=1 Tax=Herpetosiphon aurantiacus (strain ATCC 23779 / DSM 785 / 114-95) TaxID=316274 RepID=A9B667_HERA2|nr:hypothetical protein [Herpetosiphon sp.]ABX06278.1 hypothetical protein Haur_3642 [Herpetosiphon aurantiacus DSM 785]HBW48858.1 hypothetical protein [Herpetosiphon sp.]
MRRLIALGVLGLVLTSCGQTTKQPSAATPSPSQALLITPTLVEPPPTLTVLTSALPTHFDFVEAEPLFVEAIPPALEVQRVDADLRWQELPNAALLVLSQRFDDSVAALNYRDLGLFDPQGQLLFSPNHELEKLGWCSSEHSAYAPSAQWSDDGRWFLLGCQAELEQFRYAILDLAKNQWLLISAADSTGEQPSDVGVLLQHNQFWLTYNHAPSPATWVYQFEPATEHTTEISVFATMDSNVSSGLIDMQAQPDGRMLFHGWRAAARGLYLWQAGQLYRLQFEQPLLLDERLIWAENNEAALVYHTQSISSTLQQTYELKLDLKTQQVSLSNTSTAWIAPPATVARNGYSWNLRLDGWHFEHNQQAVAWLPNTEQLFTAFGDWRKTDGDAWICQVEQGVGANVLAIDATGQSRQFLHYPNVGFSYPDCVSESPSGLLAISLSNNRIVLVDAQGQELATIVGASRGWRPTGE